MGTNLLDQPSIWDPVQHPTKAHVDDIKQAALINTSFLF